MGACYGGSCYKNCKVHKKLEFYGVFTDLYALHKNKNIWLLYEFIFSGTVLYRDLLHYVISTQKLYEAIELAKKW